MTKRPRDMPEQEVADMWRRCLAQGAGLSTTAGERLEVIYPGRASGDGGPDFRDAVIVLGGERRLRGDIELHVTPSQWWQHGHHRCATYNNVILHVVLQDNEVTPAHLERCGQAPVLALDQLGRGAAAAQNATVPCRDAGERLSTARLQGVLSQAGEMRFRDKASRFQQQMQSLDPDQALYEGLLQALGYSKNKEPFLEVAQALPWYYLQAEARAWPEYEATLVLQAQLLGGAGLLPSHQGQKTTPDEPYVEALEEAWRRGGRGQVVPGPTFRQDRVRPENLPVRRLAAAGLLLCRYLELGLAAGMAELVAEAGRGGEQRRLDAALEVAATGFWASHLDFGLKVKGKGPALLGRGRAGDLVVNVVLPFVWAWAGITARESPQARALELYSRQPRLQDNGITRHMMHQLALQPRVVTTAAQQQGLLHIYKVYCTQGGCSQCRLSRA